MIGGLSFLQIALAIVIIAGIVAIVIVILNKLGIQLPSWFVQILLIIVVVLVGVVAIRLIWSLF